MSKRTTMTIECPYCGKPVASVLVCPRCGLEGCNDADCLITAGQGSYCINCCGADDDDDNDYDYG